MGKKYVSPEDYGVAFRADGDELVYTVPGTGREIRCTPCCRVDRVHTGPQAWANYHILPGGSLYARDGRWCFQPVPIQVNLDDPGDSLEYITLRDQEPFVQWIRITVREYGDPEYRIGTYPFGENDLRQMITVEQDGFLVLELERSGVVMESVSPRHPWLAGTEDFVKIIGFYTDESDARRAVKEAQ